MPLGTWELRFDSATNGILDHQRGHAGPLLPVIPGRYDRDVFVKAVREEWWHREWAFTLHPDPRDAVETVIVLHAQTIPKP